MWLLYGVLFEKCNGQSLIGGHDSSLYLALTAGAAKDLVFNSLDIQAHLTDLFVIIYFQSRSCFDRLWTSWSVMELLFWLKTNGHH